jgi:mono/diheme cytochrome c family protein
MRIFIAFFVLVVIAVVALMGWRGKLFTQTPLEIFPDMKRQYKLKPQGENKFFANGKNEQLSPDGVVATTPDNLAPQILAPSYYGDPIVATGKDADGSFHKGIPVPVTLETLQQGKKRYEIYCSACHGYVGMGDGVTKAFGMSATANLLEKRIREMSEGEIFNTVSNGKGQMLGYKNRMNTLERWEVVAYLKALQDSQNRTMKKLPTEK